MSILKGGDISNLSGLSVLTSIGGQLEVYGNIFLPSLSGLDNVTSIGGDCLIWYNYEVTSLTGLNSVTSIGGKLEIQGMITLTSLTGLDNLTSIGGDLWIIFNHELVSLSGLDNVASIKGDVWIYNNLFLTSLVGLDNIEAESIEDLRLKGNPDLSTCEVLSVCNYLASPNGIIEIHSNASGCNSQQEVEEACTVGVPEIPDKGEISVFPNPFTTSTTIEYELADPSYVQLTIYNAIGEVVYTAVDCIMPQGKHSYVWCPARLPEGLYYAVLRSEEGVSVVKMVKQ